MAEKQKHTVVHGSVLVPNDGSDKEQTGKLRSLGIGDSVDLTEAEARAMDPEGVMLVTAEAFEALKAQAKANAEAEAAMAKLKRKPLTAKQLTALAVAGKKESAKSEAAAKANAMRESQPSRAHAQKEK